MDKSLRLEIIKSLMIFFSKKESLKYEKEIFNMCKKLNKTHKETKLLDLYIRYSYEQIGFLCTADDCDKILDDMRNLKIDHDSSFYDDFRENRDVNVLINDTKIEEGIFRCRKKKCRSLRTKVYQKQDRSGDEGMTTYVECQEPGCGGRYKFN